MANASDDVIWQMHGVLHEMLGTVNSIRDRLKTLEEDFKELQDNIPALRSASESARNQREDLYNKLELANKDVDAARASIAKLRADLDLQISLLPKNKEEERPKTPTEAIVSFLISNWRIIIPFIGIVGTGLGLWSAEVGETLTPAMP